MKILSLLNVSNIHDLSRDSGFIMQRILGTELRRRGVEMALLGPATPAFQDLRLDWASTHHVPMGLTKYQVRYHVDWPAIERVLLEVRPDVILNNQVELAAALRGLLATHGLAGTTLVSYCHYLPLSGASSDGRLELDPSLNAMGMGAPIVLSLCAAAAASDRLLVQSEFARSVLARLSASVGPFAFAEKVELLAPPLDDALVGAVRSAAPRTNRVLYNHRLYGHYGTGEVIDFTTALSRDTDFELVVSDVMPNHSGLRARLDPSVAKYREELAALPFVTFSRDGGERTTYRRLIESCRVGLAPFRRGCVWSMAALDCMGLGVPVVAPSYAAFREFVPEYLCFETPEQGRALLRRLLEDDAFWLRASFDSRRSALAHGKAQAADRLLDILGGIEAERRADGIAEPPAFRIAAGAR